MGGYILVSALTEFAQTARFSISGSTHTNAEAYAQMAKRLTRSAAARVFPGSIPGLRFVYIYKGKKLMKVNNLGGFYGNTRILR